MRGWTDSQLMCRPKKLCCSQAGRVAAHDWQAVVDDEIRMGDGSLGRGGGGGGGDGGSRGSVCGVGEVWGSLGAERGKKFKRVVRQQQIPSDWPAG